MKMWVPQSIRETAMVNAISAEALGYQCGGDHHSHRIRSAGQALCFVAHMAFTHLFLINMFVMPCPPELGSQR